jgi:N-carbamoyl-L-amino-acid hydrolase
MQNTPPDPDTDRFLHDLNELRRIGAFKTGVHRPTYSPEDMQSRRSIA